MNNLRKAVMFLFAVMSFSVVFSQTAEKVNAENETSVDLDSARIVNLTIDQAVEYGLQNSVQLKTAKIDLATKQRSMDTRWNVFIPSLQASGTFVRQNKVSDSTAMIKAMFPTYSFPAFEPEEKDHWVISTSFGASLNLNAALISGIKATQNNYEAGLISYEQSEKQLKRDIQKAFYGLLLAQKNLELQKESLETSRQRVAQTKANYLAGYVPELSLLQAQVSYENTRPVIMELENSLSKQLRTFAFLLGFPINTELHLTGEIAPTYLTIDVETKSDLIKKSVSNSLDLLSLKKSVMLLDNQLEALKFQNWTPSLALSYSYAPAISLSQEMKAENWSDGGSFSATLVFNFTNLLPFSSGANNIKDAKNNLDKIELSYSSLLESTKMNVISLLESLNKSSSSIEANKMNIDLAQKAYNLTQVAYKNGTKELLDVKDSENSLNQARLGMLNEQYNYLSCLLDLQYLINE